jgi:general secretion pathway protein E
VKQAQQAYLQVTDGNGGERKVPLEGGMLTVGRNFTNLLVIEETMASRFHFVIEQAGDGFQIRDLDSRNGTTVNGKLVRTAPLNNGDVISIGKTKMKIFLEKKAATPVPAQRSQAAQAQYVDEVDAVEALAGLVAEQEQRADGGGGAHEEEEDTNTARTRIAPPAPSRKIDSDSDFEKQLRDRADALVDRTITEADISLVNARGKIAHSGEKTADTREAVTLLRLILLICFRSRATDIHIEPRAEDLHVRIRVDGMMVDVVRLNKELGVKLASVVKVLSDVDISQKNIIQEGHFSARTPNKPKPGQPTTDKERRVDYRVSFAPSMHGQKLVIRILDAANAPLHIEDLKLPPKARQILRQTSEQEAGMILVCGPTGSGKTTTLYAILRDIDVTQFNVVTIEDPVEIQLEGVTQLPVNEGQGNTFSNLLRSVLRQDPDVILIGEIRDAETARVGVQAGMTGHLVFSTVHARDALSGMFRLLDLGVEPYVVASGLHVVCAQRLVRELCPHCKVARKPDPDQVERMAKAGFPNVAKIFQPKGCRKCLGTGHFGRRGIFEVLAATTALRDTIVKNPQQQDCLKAMTPENFISMASSGYRLVVEGAACIEEVEKTIA